MNQLRSAMSLFGAMSLIMSVFVLICLGISHI